MYYVDVSGTKIELNISGYSEYFNQYYWLLHLSVNTAIIIVAAVK